MILGKQEALRLHKEMWTDMRNKYGDNPLPEQRKEFKKEWCEKRFPEEIISGNCFLCEYAKEGMFISCKKCPIVWGKYETDDTYYCRDWHNTHYLRSPISEILALPERDID